MLIINSPPSAFRIQSSLSSSFSPNCFTMLIGTKLDDKLLQGKGQGNDVRHVKIVSMKKIDEAEITRLLKEAAAIK